MFLFVIPTYNERNNIEPLSMRILELFPDSRILVVDDDSPDGTGKWCDDFAATNNRLDVLHNGNKIGIGDATIKGIILGLKSQHEWLVTMDGDGSHDPQDLSKVVEQINSDDATLWIGSRYCAGGHIESWPWHRRLTSKLLNSTAKLFLRIPVSDYSGAFRVYHHTALESIELGNIKSTGYAYLEEILVMLHRSGQAMKEFPICFNDRIEGKSKASSRQAIRAIADLTRIIVRRR